MDESDGMCSIITLYHHSRAMSSYMMCCIVIYVFCDVLLKNIEHTIGVFLFCSLGVFLSAFTVQYSYYLFVVTYGLMFGVGIGIAYAPPLAVAMNVSHSLQAVSTYEGFAYSFH